MRLPCKHCGAQEEASAATLAAQKEVTSLGQSDTERLELLSECVMDWRKLKLSDYSAMVVVAMIVAPIKPTEDDIRRAKEVVAKHPEWSRAARGLPIVSPPEPQSTASVFHSPESKQ